MITCSVTTCYGIRKNIPVFGILRIMKNLDAQRGKLEKHRGGMFLDKDRSGLQSMSCQNLEDFFLVV